MTPPPKYFLGGNSHLQSNSIKIMIHLIMGVTSALYEYEEIPPQRLVCISICSLFFFFYDPLDLLIYSSLVGMGGLKFTPALYYIPKVLAQCPYNFLLCTLHYIIKKVYHYPSYPYQDI